MKRSMMLGLVTTMVALTVGVISGPAGAKIQPNGRIVFTRYDVRVGGVVSYTMDPDGSHVQQLFFNGHSEWPHWSPDGSQIAIFCCDDGMVAHIVDVDTGAFRELAPSDPTLENHCGFAWSPDGSLLACSGFGLTDPRRNGIYTIRASDGHGVTQITSNPGGEDNPGDFSPDGSRIVFERNDPQGNGLGLFVVRLDGGGIRRLTPRSMVVDGFGGSWSPTGNHIVFVARTDQGHRRAIWEVNADGSGLHQLPVTPACGGAISDPRSIACFWPGWSPDGTHIVFTRVTAHGTRSNICVVDADGSDLVQITNTGDADEADWGTHLLAG
jgi:Tol biopolymer transport system component